MVDIFLDTFLIYTLTMHKDGYKLLASILEICLNLQLVESIILQVNYEITAKYKNTAYKFD